VGLADILEQIFWIEKFAFGFKLNKKEQFNN